MHDLDPMRARVELHGARRPGHADFGVAFDNQLSIHPDGNAVVGRGVEIDPFRARRPPDAFPAHQVVPRRAAALVDELEVNRRGMFDDRLDSMVDG